MDSIVTLLQKITAIQIKYDEIAKITGENFNIFSIMNMESNEVSTHSAIIGELLNPNGSHGQGSIFLNLFVEEIKMKFNSENLDIGLNHFEALVNEKICERTISVGNNWDNVTGGRIDIIVEDKKQILIIENKIYAIDQPYQLIRYKNYAQSRPSKNMFLFYLTLDGKDLKENEEPYSIQDDIKIMGSNFKYDKKTEYNDFVLKNNHISNIHHCLYYPISFRDDIKNWLEKCLEKVYALPIVRETLVQYLNLVKKLTNQSTNYIKTMEILELLKKNVLQSFEISRSIDSLKSKLYYEFFENLIQYSNKNEIAVDKSPLKSNTYYGLYLAPKGWDLKPYKIAVIFDTEHGSKYFGLYVAINFNADISDDEKEIIKKKFDNVTPEFEINEYNIWRDATNRDWADNPEIWEDVSKGEHSNTYKEIIALIEEIIDIEKK
jgi:PD-(D/E)XK nuclease superfamily